MSPTAPDPDPRDAAADDVRADVASGGPVPDQAMARLTVLEDRVEDLAGGFDAFEATLHRYLLTAPASASPGTPVPAAGENDAAAAGDGDDGDRDGDGDGDVTGLDMRVLVGWVRDNIALLLERRMPQSGGWPHWCQKWWLHPEAIARFEAVRRVWLDAVGQPTGAGLVVYFEHLDQQLAVLCGENGPFSGCTGGQHQPFTTARVLGQIDPDESYFRDLESGAGPRVEEEPPTIWIQRPVCEPPEPAPGWSAATVPAANGHDSRQPPGDGRRW